MIPRNDYILVRRAKPAAITPGGIHIPEGSVQKGMENVIEALGPGALTRDGVRCISQMDGLQVGDRVLVSKYSGLEVEGEPDLFLIREAEIAAILEPTSPGRVIKEKR